MIVNKVRQVAHLISASAIMSTLICPRITIYFRDIVLASHLKPLDKEDRLDKLQCNQPWNQVATRLDTSRIEEMPSGELSVSYQRWT